MKVRHTTSLSLRHVILTLAYRNVVHLELAYLLPNEFGEPPSISPDKELPC